MMAPLHAVKRRLNRWLRVDEAIWNGDELDAGLILLVYGVASLVTGWGAAGADGSAAVLSTIASWAAVAIGLVEATLSHPLIVSRDGRIADMRRSLPLAASMIWAYESLEALVQLRDAGEASGPVLVVIVITAWLTWRSAKGYLRLCTVYRVGMQARLRSGSSGSGTEAGDDP